MMLMLIDVPGKEFAPLPRYPCYFNRARRGLAPAETPDSEQDEPLAEENGRDRQVAEAPVRVAADVAQVALESIGLDALAPELPDPTRHFWWFSVSAIPERRMASGLPMLATSGSRLPPDADYWYQEGNAEWTKVDHSVRPRPEVRHRKRPSWRHRP